VSLQVREAIGPARKGDLTVVVVGLLAIVPVAALCALWMWLGYALIVAVVAWLIALLLADRGEIELPARLARLQWPVKLALPIMLTLSAALGLLQGRQWALTEQAAERSRAQVQQARERAATQRRADEAARAEATSRAAADLELALSANQPEAIERHATRLRALDQAHPVLAKLPSARPQGQAPLSEVERVAAVASGLRAARRITADRVRCESARDVGDAWSGVRRVRADEPQRREAEKLTARLERCRLAVKRALIDNAVRVRKSEIALDAAQVPLTPEQLEAFARETLAGFDLADPLVLPQG
jgi:hypothetical protein